MLSDTSNELKTVKKKLHETSRCEVNKHEQTFSHLANVVMYTSLTLTFIKK